ncbi:MAG: hypothetical protein NTX64_19075 [Elusimicrobia bacterium]|nr:hypothetical protein [Elusimicrobiota bacterium]
MTTVRRALALLVFCSAAPLPLATAQDPASDSPTASTQPRIHGRTPSATQDDLGPAPKFASKPPLDISGFSAQECAALIPQLTAYREYVNARTLWNLRKITSIGTGYFIEDCKEADEAFDKAADLAGSDTNSKAFKAAANDAFWKGSACRRDFDALFAQECSDSKDSECEAASIDKSQLDFLDDQNGKFKTDLIVREKEQGRLESCAGSGQTALLPPDKAALSSSQTQPSSQDQTISGKHSRDESLGKKRTGPSNNGSSTNGDNTSGQTSSKGQLGASDSQTSASSKKATSSNATGRTGAPAITLAKSPQSSGAGGKSQATPVFATEVP